MAEPRGTYRKTPARRGQILDAAVEVFGRVGYTAGSVSEIARIVGITQTGVLHHFRGGKVELLRQVLARRDRAAEEILSGRRGVEFLRGLLEISAAQYGQRGMVQLYRILSAEATDPEHPAHDHFRDRLGRITDALTDAFTEAGADGMLRPGVDPRAAAVSTVALTEGVELMWLNGLDVDLVEDVRRHVETFLTVPLTT